MKSRFALLLLLLSPLFAHAATPVAGVDYVEIPNGKPFAPLNGKVEVVEVFGYTCIHCAHFQPQRPQTGAHKPWTTPNCCATAAIFYWMKSA